MMRGCEYAECPTCEHEGPHTTWRDEDGTTMAECRGCSSEFAIAGPENRDVVELLTERDERGYGEGGRPI